MSRFAETLRGISARLVAAVFATLLAACGSGGDIQGDITRGLWCGDGGHRRRI